MRWTLLVIAVTSVVSTGAAFASLAIVDHLPSAFLGIGIVGPSGLWLSELRGRQDERRGVLHDMSTLWLTRLLARMREGMAEDRTAWCEKHINEDWSTDELSMAARFYQEILRDRMSAAERRRSRIYAQLNAIEARLTVARLIENGAARTKVVTSLQGSRTTKEARYSRNLNDLDQLADLLRHDAERELHRLLSVAYNSGYYRMPVFAPPRRMYSTTPEPIRPTRTSAREGAQRP